ncbi:GNAT family N-acetyltransferase [Jiangella alkaliphila]|uniref:Acetyltransferase (GNAT) family protein n=1 Tax=Jiangella alkaliphila TaxID=419479 RepID=A0A1H2KPU2_9ACTN|nr:GNAT family N-acetyltransferase [Jiangella alkaliphila]SDU70663.1 Acetyltransferase (GNAT) family protein [Jiangella alkaliphila]
MTYSYDLAADDDAAAVADLQAQSWRATYRGILPDDFLDGDLVAERRAKWTRRFADRAGMLTVLARDADGAVAGFAHSVLDDDAEWGTLLDNLHVRPGLKRQGIGRRLLAETAARLRVIVPGSRMYLWVIEANEAARRFYAAVGGEEAGRDVWDEHGPEVPIVRMGWRSLDSLAEPVR